MLFYYSLIDTIEKIFSLKHIYLENYIKKNMFQNVLNSKITKKKLCSRTDY